MSKETSVLFVNPTRQLRAGIETLSRRLPEYGYDVTVLSPSDGADQMSRYDDVEYRYYDARYVPNVRFTLPGTDFFRQLSDTVPETDVVHMYSYFYLPSSVTSMIGAASGTGVVVSVDSIPGVNWSYGQDVVDLIGRSYTASLGRVTFRCCDEVVLLGEYLRDDIQRYAGANKLSVIPNGIDTNQFSPDSSSDALTEPIELLFVGRLDPVKGIPYLLRAFRRLQRDPEREFRLSLVGDGTNRAELEARCSDLGIDSQVRFHGWEPDVTPMYNDADIFVLPALAEGQPTVLMEAQACGLPVVATDVGCARSLVESGCVVPPENSVAIADAITDVFDRWTVEMSTTARSHIVENYSEDEMCSAYDRLYSELT